MSDEMKTRPSDGSQPDVWQERLDRAEEDADRNYTERREGDRNTLEYLRRDRENADSRKRWQSNFGKVTKTVQGQRTKTQTVFADPEKTIFDSKGKSDIFRTAENRRKMSRFLGDKTRGKVSTQEREKFLGLLDEYRKTGGDSSQKLGVKDMKEFERLFRSGEAGSREKTQKFIKNLQEQGKISQTKDVRGLIGKGALRNMSNVFFKDMDRLKGGTGRASRDSGGSGLRRP